MPKCILIVDDSAAVRRALRNALGNVLGWEVCGEAVDGRDAVEKAQQFRPDLIVIDLSMPVMNGLQASKQLRRLFPHTPLVMFTNFETKHLRNEALAAGVNTVVSKTQPVQHLLSSIHSLLGTA